MTLISSKHNIATGSVHTETAGNSSDRSPYLLATDYVIKENKKIIILICEMLIAFDVTFYIAQ